MKNNILTQLFNNKRVRIIISLLLAFIAWMVVYFVQPEQTSRVSRIPIDYEYNAAPYTSQGLDIIDRSVQYVTVEVTGNGSSISGLKASDFIAYLDYNSVKGEGVYELPVLVRKTSSFDSYDISSYSMESLTVKFDKVITKAFPIIVDSVGISPDNGYYMDTAVTTPGEVTVRGPESLIATISKVVAPVVVSADKRTETVVASAGLELHDENGAIISDLSLSLSVETVEVTIPILKMKEVPLSVSFTSVPAGYDTSQLKPQLSNNSIRLAGTQSQIDAITEINVGYVDLASFVLGEPVQFNIALPEGVINLDSLLSVNVTFDTAHLVQKVISVSDIRPINVPTGMDISVNTNRINNVVLIGTQEELDALAQTSVIAQIDASDISVENGQQNVPATIIIPSTKTIFATGTYSVLCDIRKR